MIIAIVAVYLIITTTGTELSKQDVQSAYLSYLNKQNENAKKQFGSMLTNDKKQKLEDFSLEKCQELKDNNFQCLIKVKLDTPMYGEKLLHSKVLLKKEGENYSLVKEIAI